MSTSQRFISVGDQLGLVLLTGTPQVPDFVWVPAEGVLVLRHYSSTCTLVRGRCTPPGLVPGVVFWPSPLTGYVDSVHISWGPLDPDPCLYPTEGNLRS